MYILGTDNGTGMRFFRATAAAEDDDDSAVSISMVFISVGLEFPLLLLMERISAIRCGPSTDNM